MKYTRDRHLVVVDEPLIAPMVLLNLSEILFRDYKASGNHRDERDASGRLVRIVDKYYDAGLYDLSRRASEAATYMEGAGIESASDFWGFTVHPAINITKGDEVVIPKGALINSTAPASQGTFPRVSTRAQTVTVHRVSKGHYSDWSNGPNGPWRPGEVYWAGAGGYWRWVSVAELHPSAREVAA